MTSARSSRSLLFYSAGIVHKAAAYRPPAPGSYAPAVLLLRVASPASSTLSPQAFAGPALARGSASSARPLLAAWTGASHWPPHPAGDPSKPVSADGRTARGVASSWPPVARKTRPALLTPRVAVPCLDAWCSTPRPLPPAPSPRLRMSPKEPRRLPRRLPALLPFGPARPRPPAATSLAPSGRRTLPPAAAAPPRRRCAAIAPRRGRGSCLQPAARTSPLRAPGVCARAGLFEPLT
jgi:hypothetical protein